MGSLFFLKGLSETSVSMTARPINVSEFEEKRKA
jgi:hypothetical protein